MIAHRIVYLLGSLALAPAVFARDVVSFDFGWKHRTGLHAWAKPDALPPVDTDPGSHPDEAQRSYDDSDWEAVQLPHECAYSVSNAKEPWHNR